MANQRLSADEMGSLLNGLSSERTSALAPRVTSARVIDSDQPFDNLPDATVSGPASVPLTDIEHARDDPMDAAQSRVFQAIHEVLADRAARAWSEKMRGKIDVRVTKVARPSFGEFAFGLDNPTCFLTLDVPPFAGRACLEFHPTVLFPMIDRLLGGGKKAGPIVRRPLTEIETRLLSRLASIFFEQFRIAWRPYAIIAPEVHKIESNPKLSRCVPAADPVEAVEFEVNMPFARGPIRLAYPAASLVAVYDQLSGTERTPLGDLGVTSEFAEVRVLVAERSLEFDAPEYRLQVGDVLSTGVPVSSLAEVQIDREIRFVGRLGQHHGSKAIRLEEATGPAKPGDVSFRSDPMISRTNT